MGSMEGWVAPDSLLGVALAQSAARRAGCSYEGDADKPRVSQRGLSSDRSYAGHGRAVSAAYSAASRSDGAASRSPGRVSGKHGGAVSQVDMAHVSQRELHLRRHATEWHGDGGELGHSGRGGRVSRSAGQSTRGRSPARAQCAPPASRRPGAACDREVRSAQESTERRRRVVAPPPKSAAITAAQAVLQSLGFKDAYEAFAALDEQATNAVSMAELRKGLRVLKIENLEEVIGEIRSFRSLLAHHNTTVDGRTFFGVFDWSQPSKGFSHRSLNAAYRRRHHILETFRQNLPNLLRERAKREEQQLRERAMEEEQQLLRDLMPMRSGVEGARLDETLRRCRPASPHLPGHRRAVARGVSPPRAREVENELIDVLRSGRQHDGTSPYSDERCALDEDELRTSSRQVDLRHNVVQTAAMEAHQSLGPFLRLFGLERYHGRLVQYGVERVPDLLVMEDADYAELDIKVCACCALPPNREVS